MPDPRTLLVDEDVCFRYRLVSAVVALEIGGTAKSAAVRAVAGSAHVDEAGRPRQVSERTLYRWVAAYAEHWLALVTTPFRSLVMRPLGIDSMTSRCTIRRSARSSCLSSSSRSAREMFWASWVVRKATT